MSLLEHPDAVMMMKAIDNRQVFDMIPLAFRGFVDYSKPVPRGMVFESTRNAAASAPDSQRLFYVYSQWAGWGAPQGRPPDCVQAFNIQPTLFVLKANSVVPQSHAGAHHVITQ